MRFEDMHPDTMRFVTHTITLPIETAWGVLSITGNSCGFHGVDPFIYFENGDCAAIESPFGHMWCPELLPAPIESYRRSPKILMETAPACVIDHGCTKFEVKSYSWKESGIFFLESIVVGVEFPKDIHGLKWYPD